MHHRVVKVLHHVSKPHIAIGGSLAIGALAVGIAWYAVASSPTGTYVTAQSGPITEEVDVSGAVKAAQSTDLAFQASGRVASIRVKVGDTVRAGQVLIALDGSVQAAAVALAKANLETQQAKLAALSSGTRPEQLAINQTSVAQAQNALASSLASAYASADDAVHTKADQLFQNPRTAAPQLSLIVPDASLASQIVSERVAIEPLFSPWSAAISGTDPESAAVLSEADLKTIAAFLDDLTTALAEIQASGSVPAATLSAYQTAVAAGRASVLAALSATIAADTSYKSAAGALTLAQAGATGNDLAAQEAVVHGAEASLAAAQAALSQTIITAPVDGTITAQNANLGMTAVPGVPLVSMIAHGKFEAEVQVSETDIGKVKVNDPVEVTFAAYPGTVFKAAVTTVDPAATLSGGVASYGVTVTFLDTDPRLIPGLSANVRIITATKPSALQVPTSAIITDGSQKFVYVERGTTAARTPVTAGIESASGMTEITSGLSEGDLVLSFGNAH